MFNCSSNIMTVHIRRGVCGDSVLVRLVPRSIFDTTALQLSLNIIWYATFHANSIHATNIFCCWLVLARRADQYKINVQVRCHRATQLASVSMTAIVPSKWAVVHTRILSCEPFIWTQTMHVRLLYVPELDLRTCMSSSQFGHPFFLNSAGCWTIEHRRHALSCLDFACNGTDMPVMVDVERR